MGRPTVVALSVVASTLGFALSAQQGPPTFRAGTEAIVVDASVLDRNRQPIRSLTAADFTILEDGQPQEVRTFKEIDLRGGTRPPEPIWSAEHPPDVRRNDEFRGHAVVVIVLDASTPMSAEDVLHAKEVGAKIVNQLMPGDFAAVVHTMNKPAGQDFTQDRELLHASVKRFSGTIISSPRGGRIVSMPSSGVGWSLAPLEDPCTTVDPVLCRITLTTLSGIAKTLSTLPEQRKALIFVSAGMPLDPSKIGPQGMGSNGECGALHNDLFRELFAIIGEVNRSNISVYGIDPGGLRVKPNPLRLDFLRSVSLDTGGIPVLDTNDPTKQIEQIYQENQHYYLLGYQPANPRTEGRFRKIEIRVDRPDAMVRTRSGYYEPRKTSASPPAAAAPALVTAALEGQLPLGDLPLAMTAACFAGRSGKRADVAVAVEASDIAPPGQGATTSDVEMVVHAYDTGWKLKASQRLTHKLAMSPGSGRATRYALLSRLQLDPGRYQLRVAVQSALTGHRGSVYYDVTVPDFTKAPLAISGIVLDARPRAASAPPGAFTALLPFDPTARREFQAGDQAIAVVRVYQRGRKEDLPVRVTARILDGQGKVVWSAGQDIGRDGFGAGREADYRVELPVSVLAGGQYLLEVAASAGSLTARSDLRFQRR
jgi:VWFA-related protein